MEVTSANHTPIPPGRKPGSTAGRMPAATLNRYCECGVPFRLSGEKTEAARKRAGLVMAQPLAAGFGRHVARQNQLLSKRG